MRKKPFHWLVPLSLCVAVALPLPQAVAQTGDYTSLISQTTEALKNNNAEQAFQKALAAIAANPTGHEGYFYAGVAAYRQDLLDAAEKYVKQALERAPEEAKPLYQDTLKAIGEKKLFLAHVDAGQKAEADGLLAKAASEYTTAWDAFPMRTEVGLKAANLWGNRLNSPGEAARILNTILAQTSDEKVKQQANALLAPLQGALQTFYTEKMKTGENALYSNQTDEAVKAFSEAALAQPSKQEVHLLLARAYANSNDLSGVIKALGNALNSGPVDASYLMDNVGFSPILDNQQFTTWLSDAMGKATAERLTQSMKQFQTVLREKDAMQKAEGLRSLLVSSPKNTILRQAFAIAMVAYLKSHLHARYDINDSGDRRITSSEEHIYITQKGSTVVGTVDGTSIDAWFTGELTNDSLVGIQTQIYDVWGGKKGRQSFLDKIKTKAGRVLKEVKIDGDHNIITFEYPITYKIVVTGPNQQIDDFKLYYHGYSDLWIERHLISQDVNDKEIHLIWRTTRWPMEYPVTE